MRTTPLPAIHIADNRQRQEFDPTAMEELRNSIEAIGLMQAPVLRKDPVHGLVLVAGERRLRAMKDIIDLGGVIRYEGAVLQPGLVPYSLMGDLTELEAEEAELDENFRRKDLTWQEHAMAIERLHKLRQKQMQESVARAEKDVANHGVTTESVGEGDVWTTADTAKELYGRSDGAYQDSVRQELIVARHLDNPAVAKAKNASDAFKILKKQEATRKNIELAAHVGLTFTADAHTLLQGDCCDLLADPSYAGRFDVILTDPPYGMGADDFGDAGGKLVNSEHHYDDSYESWLKLMQRWVPLSFAVTKPQAHAYVFCDFDRFHELKAMMQAVGWYVFRTPLIIRKINSGRVPLPDQGPRRQYELCLYAIKGKKPVTHIYPDIIEATADDNMTHGAQKPVAVYQNLLQRSVRPGDEVLDSFAGSGPIFPSAHGFKCKATAMEQNAEYYALSFKRLKQVKALDEPALF